LDLLIFTIKMDMLKILRFKNILSQINDDFIFVKNV
jgi:hypothetical protein